MSICVSACMCVCFYQINKQIQHFTKFKSAPLFEGGILLFFATSSTQKYMQPYPHIFHQVKKGPRAITPVSKNGVVAPLPAPANCSSSIPPHYHTYIITSSSKHYLDNTLAHSICTDSLVAISIHIHNLIYYSG